jgi:hypothetical protein
MQFAPTSRWVGWSSPESATASMRGTDRCGPFHGAAREPGRVVPDRSTLARLTVARQGARLGAVARAKPDRDSRSALGAIDEQRTGVPEARCERDHYARRTVSLPRTCPSSDAVVSAPPAARQRRGRLVRGYRSPWAARNSTSIRGCPAGSGGTPSLGCQCCPGLRQRLLQDRSRRHTVWVTGN